jgi:hypothetical protein
MVSTPLNIGVSVHPGATAFTRMPSGPSSAAAMRTSWCTPAFVVP